jgi:hypothetical protein
MGDLPPRAIFVGLRWHTPCVEEREQKKPLMNAASTFSLGFAPLPESKIKTLGQLLSRQAVQRIASATSLITQAVGFSAVGMLIIMNRHQSDLNGPSGGSSVAVAGGISAILVGAVFLVAACFYCRFCAKRSAAFSASRQTSATTSYSVQNDSPGSRTLRLSWRLLPG